MVVDAAVLRRLYSAAPEEFVAARDALVKELRAAKDRDTAAEVAGLRRPSVPDWALNVVATAHPDAVNDLLDAAARLRAAQSAAIEGRGGADVRGPLTELRSHSQQVMALADGVVAGSGRASGSQLGALTTRLAEVAANEAAGEQLRGGHLGSEAVAAVDLFAGLSAPARPAGRSERAPGRAGRRTRRTEDGGDPPPKADRPTAPGAAPTTGADAATRRRLERAVTAARKAHASAGTALTRASSHVESADGAAVEAETALEAARTEQAAAEERLRLATEESARAAAAVEKAGAALERARARQSAAHEQRRRAAEDSAGAASTLDEAEAALAAG